MTEINGESTFMVWPTLGSRTAKEQNRTFKGRERKGRRGEGREEKKVGEAEFPHFFNPTLTTKMYETGVETLNVLTLNIL